MQIDFRDQIFVLHLNIVNQSKDMNVIILGGFLGSGKTTLLLSLSNYIVNNYKSVGKEISLAIIENEIGDISIDDKTIQSGGYEVSTLFSGCICCTLVSDLVSCVNDINEKINPNWIIIETTGLAYPDRVADTLKQFSKSCQNISIHVIVDAQRWEELSEILQPLLYGQIRNADGVLVNKIDLVDNDTIAQIEKDLSEINNNATIFKVSGLTGIDNEIWKNMLTIVKEIQNK